MPWAKKGCLLLACCSVVGWASLAPGTGPADPLFPRAEVAVETGSGTHRLTVELALTPAQQERGLMFRTELAEDQGMLFVHPEERPVTMWMRNTLVPLDMLFLAADGAVVRIAEDTEPLSTRLIPSGQPVKGVLELRAGTARRLGIVPGDRVVHPALRRTP